MAHLKAWDGGAALGQDLHSRVSNSSGLAVISVDGNELVDYARAGAAAEAVWILAQQYGLAVQPVSPPFLYATEGGHELRRASAAFADDLGELQYNFRRLIGAGPTESEALILRFTHAPRASVPSRRRALTRRHRADRIMES